MLQEISSVCDKNRDLTIHLRDKSLYLVQCSSKSSGEGSTEDEADVIIALKTGLTGPEGSDGTSHSRFQSQK